MVNLDGVKEVKVEKQHALDMTGQNQDALTKLVVNMLQGMASEGWTQSKLQLTDAFKTDVKGVYLVCGRLRRMKAGGEVYLDQGVVHVAVPGGGVDGSYGIQDIYFYDWAPVPPQNLLEKLGESEYFGHSARKMLLSKL